MTQESPTQALSPPIGPSTPSLPRLDAPLPPPSAAATRQRRGKATWPAAIALLVVAILGIAAGEWPASWKQWLGLSGLPIALNVSGNIEAHESVLGFKTVQSRIVELPFDEGKSVKAGSLIARVDDADYRQQTMIAEAALEVQRRQLDTTEQNLIAAEKTVASDEADVAMKKLDNDRYQLLWSHGNATTEQRDQAATSLKQSQAGLERDQALALAAARNIDLAKANIHNAEESLGMAQIVLGYTTLVAPFDGVIQVRQAELGEIAAPGTPVVTLADLDHVWLRAYINETDIGRVRLGGQAVITTDTYPGKRYQGVISFIASSAEFTPKSVETHAERVTLVYRIKIDIDNSTHELVPGMPADAAIALPVP